MRKTLSSPLRSPLSPHIHTCVHVHNNNEGFKFKEKENLHPTEATKKPNRSTKPRNSEVFKNRIRSD